MRKAIQLIREGNFAAEVSIKLHEGHGEWGPTVLTAGIQMLDRVRWALRAGDVVEAAKESDVFRLVRENRTVEPSVESGFSDNEQSGFES